MVNNNVGAVTAEIRLNTEQFEEAVKKLKGDVKEIKKSFTQKTSGNNGLLEEVKSLKKEIDSLREKTKDYQSSLKTAREENDGHVKTIKELKTELANVKKSQDSFNKGLKEEQSILDNATKSAKNYAREIVNIKGIGFKPNAKINSEVNNQLILEGMKSAYHSYDNYVQESARKEAESWKLRQSEMRNAMESMVSSIRNLSIQQRKSFASEGGYNNYLNTLSKIKGEFEKVNNVNFTKLSDNIYRNGQLVLNWGKSFTTTQAEIKNATTLVRTELKEVDGEMQKITITVGRVTDVLKTFDYQLLSTADAETKAYKRTLELASAMHKMNAQGTSNWSGRQTVGGYSTYISSINKINEGLNRQSELQAKLKSQRLDQYYSSVGSAQTKYWNQVRQGTVTLNDYKSKITQVTQAIKQQRQAQQSVNTVGNYSMQNLKVAGQGLALFDKKLKETNTSLKTGQASMREFGTRMGRAEAYSNNLYRGLQKVRSVIVSMKTIMAAMGGMAVWNFAFELVDKAKETYTAKNEMESLLNQNSKVNAEGIQVFNKALDDTISRFQKINKYSLGETTAAIGLEFDLNAKEMAESLDVIGMIQSEYVRAGRTTEEAALAVKDILQGEFMRLSRETGVGKGELQEYGWDGDNKNVKSLMRALKKAATDRHWDIFAEKATSVNDVIAITQNRFGEMGADLMTNAEPLIVGAFNEILGAVDSLKSRFEGMGTFGKYFTIGGGALTTFTLISTALMILKRDMGLAQIATLGWGRSLGTALLGLNKTDVALHGFRKTLIATISGTKASTVANMGLTKSIAAKVLGVNHDVAAQKGLLTALVANRMQMLDTGKGLGTLEKAQLRNSVASAKWYQKIGFLNGGLKASEVQTAGLRKSLLNLSVAAKATKLALFGIVSVGIIAWFASVASWTDTVKKRMETYNDVLTKGKDEISGAKKDLDSYQSKLDKLSTTDKNYDITKRNRDTVQRHINDLELSLKLAKEIKKSDKENTKANDTTYQGLINDAYDKNGVNIEKYGQTYFQIKQAAYDIKHAEDERYHFLYQSSQHINQQVAAMKEANVSEEDRVKYITEYSAKAQEAAENLKKFNKGDLNAGAYYLMNRAQLMWIDLWNNQHFIKFWEGVQKTWEEVKPTVYEIKDTLISVGEWLADFFSTDVGRYTGMILGFGTAFTIVGLKIGKWVTGSDSVFQVLKKVGGKLKDVAKGWKNVADNAEEANKKTGGSTSTGGIAGDTGGVPLKEELKGIGKNRLKSFTNNALLIAEGMALVTEAIVLLQAPMRALAWVGSDFKNMEPEIRQGIEGLQLLAPVVGAILIPIIAFHQVLSKTGNFMSSWGDLKGNLKAFATMMLGIAEGMVLVTEAIGLLVLPMSALAGLGWVKQKLGNGVEQGIEAIRITNDALYALVPWIPVFIGGIAMAATIFIAPEIALPVLGVVALGIATGMAVVTEAILTLHMPLTAIESIGARYPNLDGVKRGAEAIKLTAESLGYVEEGVRAMTLVHWELLAEYVAHLIGMNIGFNLTDLTGEGGFFDQLNTFTTEFNKIEIETPQPEKVTALAAAGDGVGTIGTAMEKVKTAMDNLPDEFKNGQTGQVGNQLGSTGNNSNGTANNTSTDTSGYFDTFKEPLKELKTFIYDFNHSEDFNIEQINTDRVANINTAADMIESVHQAVEKVKTTMQGIGDSGSAAAFAQGGWLGQAGYNLFHMTGLDAINNGTSSGNYKSSLGSQLQEMENVIDDLFTFQSNINNKGASSGGENANVDGATAMVTQIQDAISKVSQSLSNAVPQFEGKGNAISQAIITGINNGLNGLSNIGSGIVNKLANGIMTNKDMVYNTSNSLGKTTAIKFKDGVNPMSDYMTWELSYVKSAMEDRKSELGDTAYDLGSYIASRFKEGDDINSPGLMARSIQDEVNYIGNYLSVNNLPQMAFDLANALSSNFNVDFNLSNFQFPDISAWTSKLSAIPIAVANVKTQVGTSFSGMSTSVKTSLQGIATNAQSKYSQIVSNTRTSLNNMRSATLSNIGNIKSSWRGMQDALIASAEHIKSQTGSKINNLRDNMASFWKKIQNPSLLISGAAGGHTGSIRRRSAPKPHVPKGNYAGGFSFKPRRSTGAPDDGSILEYIKCLVDTGKPCYAGGWSFDWNKPIQDKFNGWNTHFGKFKIDDHVKVGKFYNNNFPVRGIAEIAKSYIFDTIRATSYAKYFNSNFGDDPVAALRAGAFNCWDGTNIVLAIARAFGFTGGGMGHGTWNGIGHVWANIPGLGIIDPTAIQQRGSFTSSAVKGYSAGSIRRGEAKQKLPATESHNHNEVHMHFHGDIYGVDDLDRRIEEGANRVQRKLFTNSLSGV